MRKTLTILFLSLMTLAVHASPGNGTGWPNGQNSGNNGGGYGNGGPNDDPPPPATDSGVPIDNTYALSALVGGTILYVLVFKKSPRRRRTV